MNRINTAEQFTLVFHALGSFENALETCNFILARRLQPAHHLYLPLVMSMCGMYGRPFTRSNVFGNLDEKDVPAQFLQIHRDLRNLRDKLYLHADGNVEWKDVEMLNNLRVTVFPDNDTVKMEVITPQGSLLHLAEVKALLEALTSIFRPLIYEYVRWQLLRKVLAPGNYILIPYGDSFELKPEDQPLHPLDRDTEPPFHGE